MVFEAQRWDEVATSVDGRDSYAPNTKVAAVFSRFADALEQIADEIDEQNARARQDDVALFDAFNPRNLECSVSL